MDKAGTNEPSVADGGWAWLQSVRPLGHGNIAVPMLVGTAWAVAAGHDFHLAAFVATHALGVVAHIVVIGSNELSDQHRDHLAQGRTWVSGGSGVLARGDLSRRALSRSLAAAVTLLGAAATLGVFLGEPAPAFFAAATVLLAFSYSWPTGRGLSTHPSGAVLQTLGVGGVLPLFAMQMQGVTLHDVSGFPWAPSMAIAFAGHVATALPDATSDRRVRKRTVVVMLGELRSDLLARFTTTLGALAIAESSGSFWPALAVLPLVFPPPDYAKGARRSTTLSVALRLLVAGQLALVLWMATLLGVLPSFP